MPVGQCCIRLPIRMCREPHADQIVMWHGTKNNFMLYGYYIIYLVIYLINNSNPVISPPVMPAD